MKSVRIDLYGKLLIGDHTTGRLEYLGTLEQIDNGVPQFIPEGRYEKWAGTLGVETTDERRLTIRVHKSVHLVARFAGKILTDEYVLDKPSKKRYKEILQK